MPPEVTPQSDYADLWNRPGYLIRRLHQIHVAMFLDECKEFNVTPVQFGVLTVLNQRGKSDIVTIARQIGVDRITVADVLRRLERRDFLTRPANATDKRTKQAQITEKGRTFVNAVQPAMAKAQERFIDSLNGDEQTLLRDLLSKLIMENNEASRAPMDQNEPTKPGR